MTAVTAAVAASAATASVFPGWLQVTLLAVLLVATSVWIGAWVAAILVARTATATLSPQVRVAFFRRFGPLYGITTTIALVVAYACGLALLIGMPWTALSTWLVVLSVILAVALYAGVLQARGQRRQRQQLARTPDDAALRARIASGARAAGVLRASLGVISVLILVLGVVRMA